MSAFHKMVGHDDGRKYLGVTLTLNVELKEDKVIEIDYCLEDLFL